MAVQPPGVVTEHTHDEFLLQGGSTTLTSDVGVVSGAWTYDVHVPGSGPSSGLGQWRTSDSYTYTKHDEDSRGGISRITEAQHYPNDNHQVFSGINSFVADDGTCRSVIRAFDNSSGTELYNSIQVNTTGIFANNAPIATLQVSTTAPTNEQGFWFNPSTGQLKVWTE